MESLSLPLAPPVGRPPVVALRLASDARLVRLAAAGSEGAMAAIFERHHQALYRYCHSIVGNGHDAADVLQNTMIKALRALPGETRKIVLRPWLYRIAHNESISLLRARRPETPLDAAAHLSDPAAAGLLDSRERLRSLTDDLGELTDRQRGALLMRELGGLEFTEVAEALDSTTGAAKQSVYEARCALQEMQDGRDMSCDAVRRSLSDGDRRTLRATRIRGHIRTCAGCRDFDAALRHRPAAVAAMIPPLPIAAASAMLHGILGGSGTHGGGLAAGLLGTAKATGGLSLAAKAAAVAALTATLAGGAVYAVPRLESSGPGHSAARPVAAETPPSTLPPPTGAPRRQAHLGAAGHTSLAASAGASKPHVPAVGVASATAGVTPLGANGAAGVSPGPSRRTQTSPGSSRAAPAGHANRTPGSARATMPGRSNSHAAASVGRAPARASVPGSSVAQHRSTGSGGAAGSAILNPQGGLTGNAGAGVVGSPGPPLVPGPRVAPKSLRP